MFREFLAVFTDADLIFFNRFVCEHISVVERVLFIGNVGVRGFFGGEELVTLIRPSMLFEYRRLVFQVYHRYTREMGRFLDVGCYELGGFRGRYRVILT